MYPDKLHLVLAEDDLDDRLLFRNVFDTIKLRHTLEICEDGIELMEHLATTGTLPHMIFLDLSMPGKSGIECLTEIRKDPRLKDISVAIYSSATSPAIAEEAFVLGANVYIKKPHDFDELKHVLTEVIYINWQYVTDGLDKENFIISC